MNYAAALEYLYGFVNFERQTPGQAASKVFNLDRIRALAERLGRPERRFRSVHVAGTKGKGSTAAFCEAIARAAGLSTGTYSSPHLVDVRERIRFDGRTVSMSVFARTLSRCLSDYEAVLAAPGDRRLTYFEALTHLAFQIFADRGVDLGIVEVGMGGRLDATNIVEPLASVITAVSMDHSAQLGGTLAEIAAEKGGIAKPGVPMVIGRQRPEALNAIRAEADAAGAGPLLVLGEDFTFEPGPRRSGAYRTMSLRTPRGEYRDLKIRMLGAHQLDNAAVAVAAMEVAAERGGFKLDESSLRRGLESARLPGRMEVAGRKPVLTVLDGAHNVDSMTRLAAAVAEEFPRRRKLVLLFAAPADKDVSGMLQAIAPGAALLVATHSGNPRSMSPEEVAELASHAGCPATAVEEDMHTALQCAQKAAGPEGLVLVTGSLYLVGGAKQALESQAQRHRGTEAQSLS
ncbi:MAG: bifunctional folylpolyglutamate synthase/dihydrofolate synthase [Planctomycetota bacterium]